MESVHKAVANHTWIEANGHGQWIHILAPQHLGNEDYYLTSFDYLVKYMAVFRGRTKNRNSLSEQQRLRQKLSCGAQPRDGLKRVDVVEPWLKCRLVN